MKSAPRPEPHPFGYRAQDQRRRDDREHRLEHDERVLGNVPGRRSKIRGHGLERDTRQSDFGKVADQGVAGSER